MTLKKQNNLVNRQKEAMNYLWNQTETLGVITKWAGVSLGIMYLIIGTLFTYFSRGKLVIVSLLFFYLSFRMFKRWWKLRYFTRDDLMNGNDYLKWYETKFHSEDVILLNIVFNEWEIKPILLNYVFENWNK